MRCGTLLLLLDVGRHESIEMNAHLTEEEWKDVGAKLRSLDKPKTSVREIKFVQCANEAGLKSFSTETLGSDTVLERIHFDRCDLSDKAVCVLSEALQKGFAKITSVTFEGSISEACPSLTQLVASPHLRSLRFHYESKIANDAFSAMCRKLVLNNSLNDLRIISCNATDDVALAIADVLDTGHQLSVCHLKFNMVEDMGMTRLAEAVARSCVTELAVGGNNIEAAGLSSLITMIRQTRSLRILDLGYTPFPVSVQSQFVTAIGTNHCLETLVLDHCFGVTDGLIDDLIDRGLKTHLSLQNVSIQSTAVSLETRKRLNAKVARLHSGTSCALVAMLSVRSFNHIGRLSLLKSIPTELIQKVGNMLQ